MHASVIKPHVSTKHLNDHQFLIFPNSLKIRVSQSAGFKGESLLAARHGKHRPPALPAEGPPGDANNELTSSCSSSSSSSSSYCRLDAARQITSPNLLIHHRDSSDTWLQKVQTLLPPAGDKDLLLHISLKSENSSFGYQNRKTVTLGTNSTVFVLRGDCGS